MSACPHCGHDISRDGPNDGFVQSVLKAISAIPADSVPDIERAVESMNKVGVAAYFRARGINQAEAAFLETVKWLRDATSRPISQEEK